jgi:hypothetical protein
VVVSDQAATTTAGVTIIQNNNNAYLYIKVDNLLCVLEGKTALESFWGCLRTSLNFRFQPRELKKRGILTNKEVVVVVVIDYDSI